jgi:predicted nucleotidyltransferase
MERKEIVDIVTAYCAERPEIVASYLFGSQASGKARPESDVDLAFLLNDSFDRSKSFDLRIRYATDLSRLLRMEVDTVLLNDANEVLSGQIFSRGMVVYGNDTPELRAFRRSKLPMIAEFSYYIDLRLASLRARFGGATHG